MAVDRLLFELPRQGLTSNLHFRPMEASKIRELAEIEVRNWPIVSSDFQSQQLIPPNHEPLTALFLFSLAVSLSP